jgi:tRNA pseudouridine synthase 9
VDDAHRDVASGWRHVRRLNSDHIVVCRCAALSFSWWGALLLDMLRVEYKNPLPTYYDQLLAGGRIRVTPHRSNAKPVVEPSALAKHELRMNDRVCITMHRHEPAVSAQRIEILHHITADSPAAAASSSSSPAVASCSQSHETIVVNKPAGIPVHASGRYLSNTIVGILKNEHGIDAFRLSP